MGTKVKRNICFVIIGIIVVYFLFYFIALRPNFLNPVFSPEYKSVTKIVLQSQTKKLEFEKDDDVFSEIMSALTDSTKNQTVSYDNIPLMTEEYSITLVAPSREKTIYPAPANYIQWSRDSKKEHYHYYVTTNDSASLYELIKTTLE